MKIYMRYYPAVFHKEDVGYSVTFPDVPPAMTQGDTFDEAFYYAQDALGLGLTDIDTGALVYPQPSDPSTIKTGKDEFVVVVPFDEIEFLKSVSNSSVKKTLTIPSWLNELATRQGVNFSKTLQAALKKELGM